MAEIKISNDELADIAFFERLTRAKVRDCINEEDRIIFIVEKGQARIAIGKNAANLKDAFKHFNKSIEIIEHSVDKRQFVKNIFHGNSVDVQIEETDGRTVAHITAPDAERGKVIGKSGRNIKMAKMLAARHHDIDDVRVVTDQQRKGPSR